MDARNRTMNILDKALQNLNIKFRPRRKLNFDLSESDEGTHPCQEQNPSCSAPDQTVEAEYTTPEEVVMCEDRNVYNAGLLEKTKKDSKRKDSSHVYLPSELKNLTHLYKIYKKTYTEEGIDIVTERVFRSIFNEKFNIGFHVPKKDKCLNFEQNIDNPGIEDEKKKHTLEKTESYNRFKAHQNIHKSDPSTLCASFDLQKVLNTPHGNSMLLFHSRKLAVHNFCVYENGTRNVYCYYWDETNGKRGANEIATLLNKYNICTVDERGTIKNLLLYCDCCPGQNRNKTIMAMLHTTLQTCTNIQTIQINFLLTGHTYMPVDSVHAVIERNLKNTIIYAPSQWYTVFTTARQEAEPYNVEFIQFKDFNRWDSVSDKYYKGNLTGKISKMRIVTFQKKKKDVIFVKTR